MKKKLIAFTLTIAMLIGSIAPMYAIADSGSYRAITEFTFTSVEPFSEGLAAVGTGFGSGFSVGYIDATGNEVIPVTSRFMDGGAFSEGLAAVRLRQDYRVGFIDRAGNTVIPFQYDYARAFSEGLAAVAILHDRSRDSLVRMMQRGIPPTSGINWGFINRQGSLVIPMQQFAAVGDFNNGLAPVARVEGHSLRWGFIDTVGNIVIPLIYTTPSSYGMRSDIPVVSEGLIAVGDDNMLEEIDPFLPIIRREDNRKFGFINTSGNVVIPFEYNDVMPFSDGLAPVARRFGNDLRWGFIDKSNNLVIPFMFSQAWPFSEGLARVVIAADWIDGTYSGGFTGFIDTSGNKTITLQGTANPHISRHDEVFSGGYARVMLDSIAGAVIDRDGSYVIPLGRFLNISSPSEGIVSVGMTNAAGFVALPIPATVAVTAAPPIMLNRPVQQVPDPLPLLDGRSPFAPATLNLGTPFTLSDGWAINHPMEFRDNRSFISVNALADIIGGYYYFDAVTGVHVIVAPHRTGRWIELRLEANSPMVTINGMSYDIESFFYNLRRERVIPGTLNPVLVSNTILVSLRFLADVYEFDFRIDGTSLIISD